ncbi:MAG: hypothetical protein ACM4AI_15290, partial [Acidobacteriota bacterium]
MTGQPLILQRDLQAGQRREGVREITSRLRLIGLLTVQSARQTDNDGADIHVIVGPRSRVRDDRLALRRGRGGRGAGGDLEDAP